MPFGASSCTSLAQRQSDAIRLVAKSAGVEADMVPMLDDFLIVVPKTEGESDELTIARAEQEGQKFDSLMHDLNLPKAPEKDQEAAFTTIWYGLIFDSKNQVYGIPERKWERLAQFFTEKLLEDDKATVKSKVDAEDLLSGLGKLHHITLVWSAGRPVLYFLWKLYYTAAFSYRQPQKLYPRKQQLRVNPDAARALSFWWEALSKVPPPRRRMLPCTTTPRAVTVDIIRLKPSPKNPETILARVPTCWWWRPERLLDDDYQKQSKNAPVQSIAIWLEILQDVIEVLDIPSDTLAIVVRTNLYKLAQAIKRDLYVKSDLGVEIANNIHRMLWQRRQCSQRGPEYPLELRTVLVEGGYPHPQN